MIEVVCAICKERITETGTSYNGKPVHIECYHKAKENDVAVPIDKTDWIVIRNKIVNLMPTGDVTAWDVIKSVKDYLYWFDNYSETKIFKTAVPIVEDKVCDFCGYLYPNHEDNCTNKEVHWLKQKLIDKENAILANAKDLCWQVWNMWNTEGIENFESWWQGKQKELFQSQSKPIVEEQGNFLDNLIEKYLGFQGKTNDKEWLQSSVKYYLESGSVSGSFYQSIKEIIKESQSLPVEQEVVEFGKYLCENNYIPILNQKDQWGKTSQGFTVLYTTKELYTEYKYKNKKL